MIIYYVTDEMAPVVLGPRDFAVQAVKWQFTMNYSRNPQSLAGEC